MSCHFSDMIAVPTTSATNRKIYVPKAGTIIKAFVHVVGIAGSSEK